MDLLQQHLDEYRRQILALTGAVQALERLQAATAEEAEDDEQATHPSDEAE